MFLFLSEQTLLIGASGTVLPLLGALGLNYLSRGQSPRSRSVPPVRLPLPGEEEVTRVEALTTELRLLYTLLGPHTIADRLRTLVEEVRGGQGSELAAVFRFDGRRFELREGAGLSPEAQQRIVLDAAIERELTVGGRIDLHPGGSSVHPPLRGLKIEERAQWPELSVLRIGSPHRMWGALVRSNPTSVQPDRQGDDMWLRVLALLGEELARSEHAVSRESELAVSCEMLELRQVADLQFAGPAQMLQEFLRRTAALSEFDRISLYLATPSGEIGPAMIRTGEGLPREVAPEWIEVEDRVLPWLSGRRGVTVFPSEELQRGGIEFPFSTVAGVPLLRDGDDIGMLLLTRRAAGNVSPSDRRLLAWAGDFLIDLLARTVDRLTIEEQARLDGLTLLANRRIFDLEFEKLLVRTVQSQQECSLLLLDLDRFKSINDLRGHQAGDMALKTVAHVVQRVLARTRESDQPLAARYGGEELAILLPGTGSVGARRIAESIREAVERTPIHDPGGEFRVTLSGGIATYPHDGRTTRGLLTAADAALYAAKNNGRNRVELSPPPR